MQFPSELLVEGQNIRVRPNLLGIEVHNPQCVEALGSGQSHIGLTCLKDTSQGHFNTVQGQSLKNKTIITPLNW